MNAIQALPRRERTIEELRRMQEDYCQQLKPYLSLLCDIENVTIHRMLITHDGKMERIDNYSPEQIEMRKQLFEAINYLKESIFGEQI